MNGNATPGATIKAVHGPTSDQLEELKQWLPPEFETMNAIELAAYERNVLRIAQSYGSALIALMVEAGALEPEQDPLEALRKLLRGGGY
jgi:hypothetical protein